MDIAIVSTSINSEPSAYADWAKIGRLIVAGDLNTPHILERFIWDLGTQHTYLTPTQQERWESSEVIGWNCIQRRNIAILEAIRTGADYIITVDDDNIPLNDIHHIIDAFEDNRMSTLFTSPLGWYDPCQHLIPPVWHRGFPYTYRHPLNEAKISTFDKIDMPVGVVASTWLGEPDVGAIDRMANPLQVYGSDVILRYSDIALAPGTWAPFNSQATAWDAKYASLMMCWPGVGRFDDIFASFIARRVLDELGVVVKYTHPLVHQDRNDHNVLTDLKNEMFGYEFQDEICEILRAVDLSDLSTVTSMQLRIYEELFNGARFLRGQTRDAFKCWMNDVKTAEMEGAQ